MEAESASPKAVISARRGSLRDRLFLGPTSHRESHQIPAEGSHEVRPAAPSTPCTGTVLGSTSLGQVDLKVGSAPGLRIVSATIS